MQHMKAQGIKLGHPPYGYQYAHQVDDKGRRLLVPLASEQETIGKPASAARARELRAQEVTLRMIGIRLRKEGLVPLRGGKWHAAHGEPIGEARERAVSSAVCAELPVSSSEESQPSPRAIRSVWNRPAPDAGCVSALTPEVTGSAPCSTVTR